MLLTTWGRVRAAVRGSRGWANKANQCVPTSLPEEVRSGLRDDSRLCSLLFRLPVKLGSVRISSAHSLLSELVQRVPGGLPASALLLWNCVFYSEARRMLSAGTSSHLPSEGEIQVHCQGQQPPCGLAPAPLSNLSSGLPSAWNRLPGALCLPRVHRCSALSFSPASRGDILTSCENQSLPPRYFLLPPHPQHSTSNYYLLAFLFAYLLT